LIEEKIPEELLPIFDFMVSAMNLDKEPEFNHLVQFAKLFPITTLNELLPLRTINHPISPKPGAI
jgi:hypothetical protein